jgi:plastocyanin
MQRARPVPALALGGLLALALAACSAGTEPGWTFAPTPSPTVAPSAAPSGSAAPSAAPSGSGAPSVAPSGGAPSVAPSGGTGGTVLTEVASGVQFQTTSLQAPANQPFQIAFDNQDASIPHDIEIADGTSKLLFVGDTVTGVAQTTYNVPPLPAGTYKFLCKWHPNMVGELKVQ